MSDDNRHRWYRFRLRTLFIAVTVLCCWLGWEASVVKQRKRALHEVQQNNAFLFMMADAYAQVFPPNAPNLKVAKIPLVRAWLGDKPVQIIYYTPHLQSYSQAERDRLAKAFPEAEFVERLAEPCHPGCFPAGTLVDSPSGPRRIEELKVGDIITTFQSNGDSSSAAIESIFTTNNRLWKVQTDLGSLLTTATQPLCMKRGAPRPASELHPGDAILCCNNGQLKSAIVAEVSQTDQTERVFNIVLENAELFVAGGFVARSKPPAQVVSQ